MSMKEEVKRIESVILVTAWEFCEEECNGRESKLCEKCTLNLWLKSALSSKEDILPYPEKSPV